MGNETEPTILDSIPDLSNYKSVTDRYFTRRYILNVDDIENNDIMLLIHSNRITLLALAPSHYFFKTRGEYKINFSVGKIDRLSNSVKGKGKKGGQILTPKSVICKIEFGEDNSFTVPCCVKGTLIEVNEGLVNNPELLKEFPDSDGYIAITRSSIELLDAMKNDLLTHEEYMKKLDFSNNK